VLGAFDGVEHCPLAAEHVPGTWQASGDVQTTAGPAAQTPALHVSGPVQALLSALHAVPSVLFEYVHMPDPGSHVPPVWHWPGIPQTTAAPGVHVPFVHVSPCVHALPSLHDVPVVGEQVPVDSEQAEQPVHVAGSFCQRPFASHVCGCAVPLHCLEPGVQTPVHAPLVGSQMKVHAFPLFCHLPVASHVCGWVPVH